MSRAYCRRTCRCGTEISTAGAAYFNHMMGHVRRGEAEVRKQDALAIQLGIELPYEFKWLIFNPKKLQTKKKTQK